MSRGRYLSTVAAIALAAYLIPEPAHAIPALGAWLFSIGAPLFLVNAASGVGLLGALAKIGLGIGISLIANKLLNKPKPSESQFETRQPIPPRSYIYGRRKTGGALAFEEARNGILYRVFLLQARELDAIEQHYLNDKPVDVDTAGFVTSAPYVQGANEFVQISIHYGTDDQVVDPLLEAAFTEWTSAHRLRGIAYVVVACEAPPKQEDFTAVFPSGPPTYAALVRGARVYDPRLDISLTGGTHDHDDPETWAWSDNPVLCALDWITDADAYGLDISRFDLDYFRDKASLCDEAVPLKAGGTIARYKVALEAYMLPEERKNVLGAILEAADLQLFRTADGTYGLRGGEWEAPTVTIDDELGHILGLRIDPPGEMDRYNELVIQYLSPELGYVEGEPDPWQEFETGEAILSKPLVLTQVPSLSQARRLAKIRMARENPEWLASLALNVFGLQTIGERAIDLAFSDLLIDGPFWVDGAPTISDTLASIDLRVRSAVPSAYDWDAATEEGEPPSVPPDTGAEMALTAPAFTLSQTDDDAVLADWTPSTNPSRTYDAQYQLYGAWDWYPMTFDEATRDNALSPAGLAYATWAVRVRERSGGAVSAWSAYQTITTSLLVSLDYQRSQNAVHWLFLGGL